MRIGTPTHSDGSRRLAARLLLAALLWEPASRPALAASVSAQVTVVPANLGVSITPQAAAGAVSGLLGSTGFSSSLSAPSLLPSLNPLPAPIAAPASAAPAPTALSALPSLGTASSSLGKAERKQAPAAIGELRALAEGTAAPAEERSGSDAASAALGKLSSRFDGTKDAPSLQAEEPAPQGAASYDPREPGVVESLIRSKEAVVVAHGKNDYREVAGESTWGNIAHSVEAAGGRPLVIEADIRRTGDGFIIFHDPTFHAGVRGYRTPPERIEAFRREHPELARQKEGHWDFLLLDEVGSYGRDELKDIRIFDRPTGREFPLIRLEGLLRSVEEPGKLSVPEHPYEARGPPAEGGVVPARTVDAGPIALYLDFKETNHLSRRLYGLSEWHWIIGSWSTERIEAFTRKALEDLSAVLGRARAHGKTFIAVRHPRVAALAREVDPGIRIMASPDTVTPETTAEEWIRAMEPFLASRPELVEIKYLRHMRDPKIRAWARERRLKILYDQIPQTDTTQFEGAYQDDLGRLIRDIVDLGSDVMIQTNTPEAVRSLVGPRTALSPTTDKTAFQP
ncbi:MAG: hypothetical protein HY927_05420 [Elusimicrobia bacterium]|nr:hypothetical protein [Elusimicrobiota bacterium]